MYFIYLKKFTNYADQFNEVHLGELSSKCQKIFQEKYSPKCISSKCTFLKCTQFCNRIPELTEWYDI